MMKTYCELCKCWYDENNQKTTPPDEDKPKRVKIKKKYEDV